MSTRLAGHELIGEGTPFDANGRSINAWRGGTSGTGSAKCSCGKFSAVLPSGNMRKAWHRAHKEEIRMEQEAKR